MIAHHLTGFSNIGTLAYSSIEKVSPHLVDYQTNLVYFSHSADIWSAGCILAELCFRITPIFSMCSLTGKCNDGNRVELKDQTVSTLIKLAWLLGRQFVEEEINSMNYYKLTLPKVIDEEGIDFMLFSAWSKLGKSAIYIEKLLSVMLNPNPNNRLTADDLVGCLQDLLSQI